MFAGGRTEKFINGPHPPDYNNTIGLQPDRLTEGSMQVTADPCDGKIDLKTVLQALQCS